MLHAPAGTDQPQVAVLLFDLLFALGDDSLHTLAKLALCFLAGHFKHLLYAFELLLGFAEMGLKGLLKLSRLRRLHDLRKSFNELGLRALLQISSVSCFVGIRVSPMLINEPRPSFWVYRS
jgi:hypothetical protein